MGLLLVDPKQTILATEELLTFEHSQELAQITMPESLLVTMPGTLRETVKRILQETS